MRYYILMGDVIGSGSKNQVQLQRQLRALIDECNDKFARDNLSPFTITLGDEFQGVSESAESLLKVLFFLEEEKLRKEYSFKLHYVAYWGEISTSINSSIAHGMMGSGLTEARKLLSKKGRSRPRFTFKNYSQSIDVIFNNLFFIVERISDRWKLADYKLIWEMLHRSNPEVAKKIHKDRSLIWKRRDSLRVEEYSRLKQSLFELVATLEIPESSQSEKHK